VKLSVYFKVLACNVKRMVRYLAEKARKSLKNEVAAPSRVPDAMMYSAAHYSAPRRILWARKTGWKMGSAA